MVARLSTLTTPSPRPAVRAPSATPAARPARGTGGVGLGLFLTRRIAEAHGGSASVDSRLGEGTTFRITLPAEGDGPPAA